VLSAAGGLFGRLDIAVANAGIITVGLLLETSDDWERHFGVNMTVVWIAAPTARARTRLP